MPLLWASLFFLSGILLADIVSLSGTVWLILILAALLLVVLSMALLRWVSPGLFALYMSKSMLSLLHPLLRWVSPGLFAPFSSRASFLSFLLLMFLLGAARYHAAQPDLDAQDFITAYLDATDQVVLRGVIVEPPRVRDTAIELRVRCEVVSPAEGLPFVPVHGLVLARLPVEGVWHYGDRVQLRGILQTPPEGEDFSYRQYLARHGVYAYMPNAKGTRLPWQGGNPLLRALYALRERANGLIVRLWQDPEGALLATRATSQNLSGRLFSAVARLTSLPSVGSMLRWYRRCSCDGSRVGWGNGVARWQPEWELHCMPCWLALRRRWCALP